MESKIQKDTSVCYICNRPMLTKNKHHIFNGNKLREYSEEDSMYIFVHPNCHMLIHNDPKLARRLKERGQEVWEAEYMDKYECDISEARYSFMKRYGKNYAVGRG